MGDSTRRPDSPQSVSRTGEEPRPATGPFPDRPVVNDPASVPVKASATVLVLRRAPHPGTAEPPNGGDHSADRHDTDRHDADRHDADRHDADRLDTDRHDTDQHGTDRHEVLLLRRNDRSGFVAGVHLYPGGAVDASDADIPLSDDDTPGTARAVAQIDRIAIAAAVRECFEEAGILLALTAEQRWADQEHVSKVGAEEPFAEALRRLGLTVPVHRFVSWGRWVTPMGAPRRYDTRFFAVEVPTAAIRVDGREIVHGAWWDPAAALAAERAGEIRFVTPTRKTLERLVGHRWTNPDGS